MYGGYLDRAVECELDVDRKKALKTAMRMIDYEPRSRPSAAKYLTLPWLTTTLPDAKKGTPKPKVSRHTTSRLKHHPQHEQNAPREKGHEDRNQIVRGEEMVRHMKT